MSSPEEVKEYIAYWKSKVPNSYVYVISALEKFNVEAVFYKIIELLPEAPPFYPKDQLTDKPERFFVNETIREKNSKKTLQKEVPYAVEVLTESFQEEEHLIKIRALVMVERDTQKGIIIGHKGAAIKRGTEARKDLAYFFLEKKIFLELYVKVNKN